MLRFEWKIVELTWLQVQNGFISLADKVCEPSIMCSCMFEGGHVNILYVTGESLRPEPFGKSFVIKCLSIPSL